MKTEKRMACFIVSAALLIVTLWFTSCSSTSADAETKTEAETADHPCYHVTVYSPAIEKVGYAGRRKPKYTITVDNLVSWCQTRNFLQSESTSSCKSLWKMDDLSWYPHLWWRSSITEGRGYEHESSHFEYPA